MITKTSRGLTAKYAREQAGEPGKRPAAIGAHRHPHLPKIEEHIGLLVENNFDVACMYEGIVHLVPLPTASLKRKKGLVTASGTDTQR